MQRSSPPPLLGPSRCAPGLLAELDRHFGLREEGQSEGRRVYLDTPERRLTARGERLWLSRQGDVLRICHRVRLGRNPRQASASALPRSIEELPVELRRGVLRRAAPETPLDVLAVVDWRLRFAALEGDAGDAPLVLEERRSRKGRESQSMSAVVVMRPGAGAEVVRAIELVASHHGFAAIEEDELEAALRSATAAVDRLAACRRPAGRALLDALRDERAALRRALPAAVERHDPEALHLMRVALRRTRVLLSNFQELLPPRMRQRFARDFAWLQDASAAARDLDVLWQQGLSFEPPAESEALATAPEDTGAAPSPAAIAALRTAIEIARRDAHEDCRELAESLRAQRFFRAWDALLARAPESLSARANERLGPLVQEKLARRARKLRKLAQALPEKAAPEALHGVRIAAKNLRYLVEAFQELCRQKPLARMLRSLRRVQDVLGVRNDAAVQRQLLGALAVPPEAQTALHSSCAVRDAVAELGLDSELERRLRKLVAELRPKRVRKLLPLDVAR